VTTISLTSASSSRTAASSSRSCLTPITLSAVIVLGHISLKIFDLVVAMTGSGPGFSTDVPAFYMFDTTFRGNHFAQGAGIAMIILLVVAVLVIPYLIYSARTEVQQ